MSKKLIQTTLRFSSSQPSRANDKVAKPDLKRKISDSLGEHNLDDPDKKTKMSFSYASVAAKNPDNSSGHNNKSAGLHSSQAKGNDTHHGTKDLGFVTEKQAWKKGPESSTSSGFSSTQHSSGEHGKLPYPISQFKSDNYESTGSDSSIHVFSYLPSDLDSDDSRKPSFSFSKGSNHGHARKGIEKEKPQSLQEGNHKWMGVPLSDLKRAPECFKKRGISLPPLRASSTHKVLFEVTDDGWNNEMPKPFNESGRSDIWDDEHVHMPNSSRNEFTENGSCWSRWDKIELALKRRIVGSFELQDVILSYNPHYKGRWNFDALHQFFEENEDGAMMKDDFFEKILPEMQRLALKLPKLCPKALPILKQRHNMKLTLSQQQIACLLANAFFCTFPRRNFKVRNGHLPDINFSNLFSDSHSVRKFQKFRCIINYFQRVTKNMPIGTVTYARQHISAERYFWKNMDKTFTNLHVSTSGTIEDDGKGMLQADFANKYVGGGVLGHGLVQEEIRFLICPEMILSRLFTEVLTDSEVLIMTGCERFSNYEGYSESFKFSGNHEDQTERDEWGRRYTEVVAMDAVVIRRDCFESQFERDKLMRELNKAYCAFKGNQYTSSPLPAVCTGNWGCGAFGGDKQLKALIQMMAASAVERDICYFTFGDSTFCDQLGEFYKILKKNDLAIRNALDLIRNYEKFLRSGSNMSLFEYIAQVMGSSRDPEEETYNAANVSSMMSNDDSPSSDEYDSDKKFRASTP